MALPEVSDPQVLAFAAELAKNDGLVESEVLATLEEASVQQSILDAIARPAESKAWKDYRPIFISDRRIDDGVVFYGQHRELIDRIAGEFGVPAEIIVAIIGVETNYGRNIGRYRVLDALYTLAFHYPPRSPYFRGELRQLFLLGNDRLAYPIDQLKGSYAGAMGLGQFMPTSIATWARDYDGDGRIDLWNSYPDIVASIANYFVEHGWERDAPVTVRAVRDATARPVERTTLEPLLSVQQLEAWGYAPTAPVDAERAATLLTLEGPETEDWIIFRNFYVISRYNRSPLYSMAVWQLSQAIARGAAGDRP
ncbi:lytic murein transglycosylase B [Dokdonella koreensis]|uniref:Lytic murein transglycosylase B n=1 Tax=Dokdonella koreensis DS-123 TaxID=1300342 RepID=A0A160DWN7_9GAMM|nr:lytic murein transglycosylase B [Dokdonella koreensis]ANB19059.1 Lytic murein transglycosylase B [Dokdonella koreensis DS-123]